MNWLENIIFLLTGLGGGILVAGGLFAFLVLIGVITRLAAGTKTAKFFMFYEDFDMFYALFFTYSVLYAL